MPINYLFPACIQVCIFASIAKWQSKLQIAPAAVEKSSYYLCVFWVKYNSTTHCLLLSIMHLTMLSRLIWDLLTDVFLLWRERWGPVLKTVFFFPVSLIYLAETASSHLQFSCEKWMRISCLDSQFSCHILIRNLGSLIYFYVWSCSLVLREGCSIVLRPISSWQIYVKWGN